MSSFTHPHDVPNLYYSSVKKEDILENVGNTFGENPPRTQKNSDISLKKCMIPLGTWPSNGPHQIVSSHIFALTWHQVAHAKLAVHAVNHAAPGICGDSSKATGKEQSRLGEEGFA